MKKLKQIICVMIIAIIYCAGSAQAAEKKKELTEIQQYRMFPSLLIKKDKIYAEWVASYPNGNENGICARDDRYFKVLVDILPINPSAISLWEYGCWISYLSEHRDPTSAGREEDLRNVVLLRSIMRDIVKYTDLAIQAGIDSEARNELIRQKKK